MEEQNFQKNPDDNNTISYQAKKEVEKDLHDMEHKAKRDVTAGINKKQFLEDKKKVYCKQCKFRKNKKCISKNVLVSFGKFSKNALDCDTEQFIDIFEANNNNDCQFFEKKEVKDVKKILRNFIFFSFIGISCLIAALIGIIYYIF